MKNGRPDFTRNVHCLFGLPFDAVTLDQAVVRIRTAIERRTPCFFSTPNLNFLIAAQANAAFRQSVVHSDLSVPDGMPIVWLARLLNVPIPERVAGSDVFDALRNSDGPTVRVYFFGGPPGVAERAGRQINSENKGMTCVGFDSPGFGSIESMSDAATIDKINRSGADFLVVSLGAAKGQAWIEHNLRALEVPVVSHLGAVVNFVAGGVKRAPRWMQKTGLEWAWRIWEEPALWKRYAHDGLGLLKLLATAAIPFLYYKWLHRQSPLGVIAAQIECDNLPEIGVHRQGEGIADVGKAIQDALFRIDGHCKKMTVKISGVSVIPSDVLALFQLLDSHAQTTLGIVVNNVKPSALRQLVLSGCRYEQNNG